MILTNFLIGISLSCTPCDTVAPSPQMNLDELIAQNSHIDEKGRVITTDDILLPQSRSEITGKAIVIPKGAIITNAQNKTLPEKKKRSKK